jgi:prevent-host-death family protein
MTEVTIRDLRNHGDDVINRVMRGESLIVTRRGTPMAELRPLMRQELEATTLLKRWRHLPMLDGEKLRDDIDQICRQP